MGVERGRIRAISHSSGAGTWELVLCRPTPQLAPYVRDYHGYRERTATPVRRIEVTTPAAVVIVNFGPAWRLGDGRAPERMATHGSFVAGLYSTYAVSENTGASHCLQFNLTPLGARRILGLPLHHLANRIVDLADVLGKEALELEERIADTIGWPARFALLDEFLEARIAAAAQVSPVVLAAWQRLERSGGMVPVSGLARDLDISRKHLSVRFREAFGLPPRTVARLLRFRRVIDGLAAEQAPRWSELAVDCGYYDQAHLIRDFHQFAGMSPRAFMRSRLPDGSGVIDDLGL